MEEKEEKPKTINERLKLIEDNFEVIGGKKKKKPFSLPFSVKSSLRSLAKQNKVLVFYCKTNRTITPLIASMKDGMVQVGERMYNASTDFVFLYQGKHPAMVIKEYDINPVGTLDYYDAVENKRIIDPQTIIIRAMKAQEGLMMRGTLPGKTWIWIGIGVIIVAYVLFGQG